MTNTVVARGPAACAACGAALGPDLERRCVEAHDSLELSRGLMCLIGEAFLGWLATDGYGAYRHHPRRQRCLAHLIREGLALALGYYGADAGFGHDLVRDLRCLIERVHDGEDAQTPAVNRLMTRIKWNYQCNRREDEKKVRELAGEILNDWDAVVAFVYDPKLPPTNNDADRAPRRDRKVYQLRNPNRRRQPLLRRGP